jgi:hypothetical protein
MYRAARPCISWEQGPGAGVIIRGTELTSTRDQLGLYTIFLLGHCLKTRLPDAAPEHKCCAIHGADYQATPPEEG